MAIIKVFKTCCHYLEVCIYKVPILTNHNNLQYFIDINNLNFRQVQQAQKLSYYHFQIDYC